MNPRQVQFKDATRKEYACIPVVAGGRRDGARMAGTVGLGRPGGPALPVTRPDPGIDHRCWARKSSMRRSGQSLFAFRAIAVGGHGDQMIDVGTVYLELWSRGRPTDNERRPRLGVELRSEDAATRRAVWRVPPDGCAYAPCRDGRAPPMRLQHRLLVSAPIAWHVSVGVSLRAQVRRSTREGVARSRVTVTRIRRLRTATRAVEGRPALHPLEPPGWVAFDAEVQTEIR